MVVKVVKSEELTIHAAPTSAGFESETRGEVWWMMSGDILLHTLDESHRQ